MYPDRKTYGYPPYRKDPEVYRAIEATNKNMGKAGFCLGMLVVGGYMLYKKVSDLSKEVKKLKEETGK